MRSASSFTRSFFQDFHSVTYIVLILDFLIYFDRGILPGLHEEVVDELIDHDPELFFGILQSTFVAGLAISAPLLAYMSIKFKMLLGFVAAGLSLWNLSMFGCFISGSYRWLGAFFLFRGLSGLGEAAFTSLMVPSMVDCQKPNRRSVFLGLFYALMPLGVSAGYVISSLFPVWLGLSFPSAFGLLGMVALPYVVIITLMSRLPEAKGISPWATTSTAASVENDFETYMEQRARTAEFTPKQVRPDIEIVVGSDSVPMSRRSARNCSPYTPDYLAKESSTTDTIGSRAKINVPLFVSILISGAAQAGLIVSLAAFGSAFLLGLKVFNSEVAASSTMGMVAVCVGAVGTFTGGVVAQKALDSQESQDKRSTAHVCSLIIFVCGLVGSFICLLTPIFMYYEFYISSLVVMGAGVLLVSMVQSSMNLGVMSSCSDEYRSLALSIYTLGIHFFGDVPGPILIGYLKDWAALPSCDGADCDEMRRQNLILVIAFLLSWTVPIWVGGAMALTAASSTSTSVF